jgi:hypothetical protein
MGRLVIFIFYNGSKEWIGDSLSLHGKSARKSTEFIAGPNLMLAHLAAKMTAVQSLT